MDHPNDVHSLEQRSGDRAGDMDRNMVACGQDRNHLAASELDLQLAMVMFPMFILSAPL
jgi:hypothetical protein